MLSNLTVVRSSTARVLFLASAAITVAIMLWSTRLAGRNHSVDLSYIFYFLFTYYDYAAAIGVLLILAGAVFVPRRFPSDRKSVV